MENIQLLRLLPDHLVNQIAAGEVIERPSAAIKELVENAIDAGATQIDIRIRDGGQSFISVADNGHGMSKDELPLAIQRHATSKLDSEDLLNIKTMGFRGEALPSIGSVAKMRISSRIKDAENGWQITVDAGKASAPQPSPQSQGTLIEVSDLFYATPARLKFLKSSRAEAMAISDIIQRLAMANPSVGFSLHNEVKMVFQYPAISGTDIQQARLLRLKAVLGKEFAQNALAVDTQKDNIRLSGWISLPTFNRRTADKQFLFINNRSVRDRLLHGAIRGGYQGWITDGRHPAAALYIDMPYEAVDVNVHPAKTEVRFRDAALMRALMVGGIRQTINESNFQTSSELSSSMMANLRIEGQEKLKQAPSLFQNHGSQAQEDTKSYTPHHSFYQAPARPRPTMPQNELNNLMNSPTPQDFAHSVQSYEFEDSEPNIHDFPLGLARAQLHQNYIIAQTENSIVIVDQHAAHERLTHQKIEAALLDGSVASQSLLLPEVVNVTAQETYALLERASELEEMGLVIESFGEDAILVRSTPAILGESDIQGLIKDLASELITYDTATALKSRLSDICATLACHGSIRSGRRLNIEEMNHLLREMEKTKGSGQCSHGRPTWVELRLTDIEKLFGRR